AILHAAAGVQVLELRPHLGLHALELRQAIQADDRRRADQIEHRVGDVAGERHETGVATSEANDDTHGVRDGSNQSRVLLFPGALGDLCLARPALRALARRHAGASVTLAVSGRLRALAAATGVPDVAAAMDDVASVGLFADVPPPAWLGERPVLYAWLGR